MFFKGWLVACIHAAIAVFFLDLAETQINYLPEGEVCKALCPGNKWTCKPTRFCSKNANGSSEERSAPVCETRLICCGPETSSTTATPTATVRPHPTNYKCKRSEVCEALAPGNMGTCNSTSSCPKNSNGPSEERWAPICEPGLICCGPEPPPTTATPTATVRKHRTLSRCKRSCKKLPPPPLPSFRLERRVFGKDAEPTEFSYMARVGYDSQKAGEIIWMCGGSFITNRFVLTAAHCVSTMKARATWALAGEYDAFSTADEENQMAQTQLRRIVENLTPPGYVAEAYYNDIALCRLERGVMFNKFVTPICLNDDHNVPSPFSSVSVAGWGANIKGENFLGHRIGTGILQTANLTLEATKDCDEKLRPHISSQKLSKGVAGESMLCAGVANSTEDTCQGDSGGAMVIYLKGSGCKYLQVGITSFGHDCGTGLPAVYTRVSHFIPWIASKV